MTNNVTAAMGAAFEGFSTNAILPATKPYSIVIRPHEEARRKSVPSVLDPQMLKTIGNSGYLF